MHLAVEHDESPEERKRDTARTSPSSILHDFFPRQNRGERESSDSAFYLSLELSGEGSRACVVLFARGRHRSKNTSLVNDIILSRETQPIIQRHVFVARLARTGSRASGYHRRNCRVAITFPRKSTNFYPVTCWRAITVALNSDTVCCSCSNNKFRRYPPRTKFSFLEYQWRSVSTKRARALIKQKSLHLALTKAKRARVSSFLRRL